MREPRVFIIGQSLFAESLTQLLSSTADVSVAGHSPTVVDAMPTFNPEAVDVVILASTIAEPIADDVDVLLAAAPHVAIISTNLDENTVQIITRQQVDARLSDLLAVLSTLPEMPKSSNEADKSSNGGL